MFHLPSQRVHDFVVRCLGSPSAGAEADALGVGPGGVAQSRARAKATYKTFCLRRPTTPHRALLSPDDGSGQDASDPQSWNLYSYVGNNPLTNTDPDGHCGYSVSNAMDTDGNVLFSLRTEDRSDCQGSLNASQTGLYQAFQRGMGNAADAVSHFTSQFKNIINTPGGAGCLAAATGTGAMTGGEIGAGVGLVGLAGGPAVAVTEPTAIAVGAVNGGGLGFMLGMAGCPGGGAGSGSGGGGKSGASAAKEITSNSEADRIAQQGGYKDAHDLKERIVVAHGAQYDLYKQPNGDIELFGKGGIGEGIKTGINVNH